MDSRWPIQAGCVTRRRSRQGGFALLLVLIAVGMALTLALGFVSTQSTAMGVMRNIEDHTQARYVAESGLAMVTYYIRSDSTWRDDRVEGSWVTDQAWGDGTFSVQVFDGDQAGGDGDLADDVSDTVFVTAVGSFGSATHTVEAVITPTANAGTKHMLLIVPDPGALDALDTIKKSKLKGLNWSVTLLDDSSSASELAAAVEGQDLIYVSQTATDAQLGALLIGSTLGVVSENAQVSIDMGLVDSFSNFGGVNISIYDSTHYITQPFVTGNLGVFSFGVAMHKAEIADWAPGARPLATKSGQTDAALLAVDLGATLNDASGARGRRVHLPWSRENADYSLLTVDGSNLLERVLNWAAVSKFLSASDNGITANTTVIVSDNAMIDSFNSTEGAYGGANIDDKAVVSTNGSSPGDISVTGAAVLHGFALADPTSVIVGTVPDQITGSKIQLAQAVEMPTIDDPSASLPASLGDVVISSSMTISADVHYNSLAINSGAVVTIGADVTMLCDDGLTIDGATLRVTTGHVLNLYVNDAFTSKGGAMVNTEGGDPNRLMLYQMASAHVEFEDTSHTYARVSAPDGMLHVIDDAHFYGTFIGDRVEVENSGQIHQDTSDAGAEATRPIVEYEFHESAAPEPALIHHWPLDDGAHGVTLSETLLVESSGRVEPLSGTVHVQSNATAVNTILAQDSGVIDSAYIQVGVGAATSTAVKITNSATINGAGAGDALVDVGVLSTPVTVPSVSTADVNESDSQLVLSSGTLDLGAETYYQAVTLSGSATLNVTTHTTLVCAGDFNMSGGAQITLQPDASLKLYTLGAFAMTDSALANVNSADPTALMIYHQSANGFTVQSGASVYAQVYHPSAQVTLGGNAHFYGSSNGQNLVVQDAAVYHGTGAASAPGAAIESGYSGAFADTQDSMKRKQVATRVTVTEQVDVTSIAAYVSESAKVRYGIYSDNAGTPGTPGEPGELLAVTAKTTKPDAGFSWFTLNLSSSVTLEPGQYWLALWFQDNNTQAYRYEASGQSHVAGGSGFSNTWPGATTALDRKISITLNATATGVQNITPGSAMDMAGAITGTYTGSPTARHAGHATDDYAVHFDGVDDYLLMDHDDGMLLDSGSLSLWLKADDLSGDHFLISKDATSFGAGGHLQLYTSGSRIKAQLDSADDSYAIQSGNVLSTGQWVHVVVTWGARGFKLFIDGAKVDSDSYTGGLGANSGSTGNTEPLVLAGNAEDSSSGDHTPLTDYFEGYLSDVRFYENALGENQVVDLYNGDALSANTDPGVTVVDTAGFGAPLDLNIADPANTSWVAGGGLTIHSATQVISPGPATKMYDAITATNRMTVEVIFQPGNLTQNGSARIATYAQSTGSENFIVGQNRKAWLYRVRTTNTGSNGLPSIESTDVLTTTGRHHFIATYDETEVKIYRDGVLEMTTPRTGSFASWDNTLLFTLANDTNGAHPWLGTLYRIAVYDEVLNSLQLEDLFIGAPPDATGSGDSDIGFDSRWIENP